MSFVDLTTIHHPSVYAGCRGVEYEIQPIFQPTVFEKIQGRAAEGLPQPDLAF